eukprot:4672771-Amphidinium_carterae.2
MSKDLEDQGGELSGIPEQREVKVRLSRSAGEAGLLPAEELRETMGTGAAGAEASAETSAGPAVIDPMEEDKAGQKREAEVSLDDLAELTEA